MRKKGIVVIIITILFGLSMIISIPIIILSYGFSSYTTIEHYEYHEYTPIDSFEIEDLNLNVDVGNIEITYNYAPVDYHVRIELNIEMSGKNLIGENYIDFFSVDWGNISTNPSFSMKLLSDTWFDTSIWYKKNVSIIITLNANILFDINCTVNKEGSVEVLVPFGIHINNVAINVSKGNILYDFPYCFIEGNITGYVNSGDIELKVNNAMYVRNSIWDLSNNKGTIVFDIIQYKEMGANITGIGETNNGQIQVIYKDYNPNVGALFTFHNIVAYGDSIWNGFNPEIETNENKWWLSRFLFYSDNFPAKNHYNISLYRHNREGDYLYNLLNINTTIS